MRTIYKYPLQITDGQTLFLPHGAKVLSVQFQHERLYLWALVETDSPKIERHFLIAGTGNPISYDGRMDHISTVQEDGGALIWHVFEIWS